MPQKPLIWLVVAATIAASSIRAESNTVDQSKPGTPGNAFGAGACTSAAAAFGRADSGDDINRAREVDNETQRLRPILSTLSDDVLIAYGAGTMSIGTYLVSKGHGFSAMTEPMLVAAFAAETKRRDEARANSQALINGTILALIATAFGGILGYATHYLQTRKAKPAVKAPATAQTPPAPSSAQDSTG